MKNFRFYNVLLALLTMTILSSTASAQVVNVPPATRLTGTMPTGDAEGFCAQFTKGSKDVPNNSHVMDTIAKTINLLNKTGTAPVRHDPDLTFFGIVPTLNLHDAANTNTTAEVSNDQLFPWSKPHSSWSNQVCDSNGAGIGASDGERIAVRLQGNLHVRQAGIKTFAARIDDGYRLIIGGQTVVEFDGLRAARVDTVRVRFTEVGIYPIEVIYYENTDAAVLEMFVADREITFTGDTDGTASGAKPNNVQVSGNPNTGKDLKYVTLSTLPAGFRLLSYEDVGLPSWEPAVKPANYTNCRNLVGKPSDICVIDAPALTCGNGVIDALPNNRVEGCDDGNTVAGDGCNATCGVETGWTCVGQPSTCFRDADGDGIADGVDNCPTIANANQIDSNGNGIGDACDVLIANPVNGSTIGTKNVVVSGTTAPNTVVAIVLDGVQVGTATSNASGVWTYTLQNVAEGAHVVIANATVAGKAVSDTVSFTVNSQNFIEIATPANGSTVTDATPTVEGTTIPGATVSVIVDGQPVGTTVADAAGNWSFTLTAALADGSHKIDAETTNAGGVKVSASTTFVVDSTSGNGPLVITSPQDGDKLKTPTPTITGTTEPGVTVTVSVDGNVVGTVVADGDGNWSLPLTDELADGMHTIDAEAVINGNVEKDSVSFEVKRPGAGDSSISITSPTSGQIVTTSSPTVTGTAPAGATVTIVVDDVVVGTTVADANGNWSFKLPNPIADGSHTIDAQTEIDGVPSEASVSFEVKHAGPDLVVISPTDGGSIYGDEPIVVTGTATPGSQIDIYVDGVLVGTTQAGDDGKWSEEIPGMEPGKAEISVVASDDKGNETTATIQVEVFEFVPGVNENTLTGGGMLCSAAPGNIGGGSGFAGILALVLGAAFWRRRRA